LEVNTLAKSSGQRTTGKQKVGRDICSGGANAAKGRQGSATD
jgi:hypothetical protein